MIHNGGFHSGASGAGSHTSDFTNNGVVVLELNMNERALFFWVNGTFMSHAFTNIPTAVHFGVYQDLFIYLLIYLLIFTY
jgi:hypothetical protein